MQNIIQRIIMVLSVFGCTFSMYAKDEHRKEDMKVQVGAKETKKVSLVVIGIGDHDRKNLGGVANVVQRDLEFTGQFTVASMHMNAIPHKKDIQKLETQGHAIAAFIEGDKKGRSFFVRLYDVAQGSMISQRGYEVEKTSELPRGWGHALADLILEKLTNNKGFFSTKLSYCKQLPQGGRQVCIADYDGTHEQVVAQANMLLAPRWNMDEDAPEIFYSKRTSHNIRLMKIDLLTGKQMAVVSYEGLNMLPTFSSERDEMVMCLSCKGTNQLYSVTEQKHKKGMHFTQLTFNSGNNISPALLENGDIIFCSDFESTMPQLYKLVRKTGDIFCISGSGQVCFAPAYCPENHKIAYTKIIDGVGQLFLYNVKTGFDKQLTFDEGHKQEVAWSPCGNYLAFELRMGDSKRIAIQSLLTGKRTCITSDTMLCTYPSWSPYFSTFPLLK